MKKTNKGSSLVIVLTFSLIFIIIASVTSMAVVNTLKANSAETRYQNLYYEAEAGIEKVLALSNNSNKYNSMTDEEVYGPEVSGHTFDIGEATVKVSVKNTGDKTEGGYTNRYLQVESTAISKKNSSVSRVVSAKLGKTYTGIPNLFKYTLSGKTLKVDSGGSLSIDLGLINSGTNLGELLGGSVSEGKQDNIDYDMPQFTNIPKKDTVTISLSTEKSGTDGLKEALDKEEAVAKIEVNTAVKGKYPIYLVNASELVLEVEGGQYIDMFIMCSGKVTIKTSDTMTLTCGGIIGQSVTIAKNNLHLSYAAYEPGSNGMGFS